MEVIWYDALITTDSYKSLEDIKKKNAHMCLRKTVGYYIGEIDNYIVLCTDLILDMEDITEPFEALLSIPKGMIKESKYLE